MGHFNAHLPDYLPYRCNKMGKMIIYLQQILDVNTINVGAPTIGHTQGSSGSVLDLQLVSSNLTFICTSAILSEDFGSYHYPVTLVIPIKLYVTKRKSLWSLCNSISPSLGSKRIWGLIRDFQINLLKQILSQMIQTRRNYLSYKMI